MVFRRDKCLSGAVPTPREQRDDGRRHFRFRIIARGPSQGIERLYFEEALTFTLEAPDTPWRPALLSWIDAYLNGVQPLSLPPLAKPLTPLQEAIASVPFGQTKTYGTLVGPRYAQAVGQACARNPYPLLIPCHRILAAHGIGGFAFGSTVKEQLLNFEAAYCAGVTDSSFS